MFGAAGGGIMGLLILLVVPEDTPGHLYYPAAVAAVLSTICALLVHFKCPEPARQAPPPKLIVHVFNKADKNVFVNDQGMVSSKIQGPYTKAFWTKLSGKIPPQGCYAIANEVK